MNEKLKQELLSMREKDVSTRKKLSDSGELTYDSYHLEMKKVHENNNLRMKAIVDEHGWPKESSVGVEGAEAAWLIVQHAVLDPEFQKNALAL